MPDIEVERTLTDYISGTDAALQAVLGSVKQKTSIPATKVVAGINLPKAYPFTAPAMTPRMMYFWQAR